MSKLRFAWLDADECRSAYKGFLIEGANKIQSVYIMDYTTEYSQHIAEFLHEYRTHAYRVDFGKYDFSNIHKTFYFDETEDPTQFKYVGTPKHTVDDIKKWCEAYIASCYIKEYESRKKQYEIAKERADQFLAMGFTADVIVEPTTDSHTYLNKVAADIKEQEITPAPKTRYRWIQWGRDSAYNKYYRCSCCNHEIMLDDMCDQELPNSCEHCGAKMI